jgi:hypothetical protein
MRAVACLPTNAEMQATSGMKANRTANTEGTLAKVVKPATAWKGTNYSSDTVNIKDDSSSKDNRNIMDVNSSRTARIRQ